MPDGVAEVAPARAARPRAPAPVHFPAAAADAAPAIDAALAALAEGEGARAAVTALLRARLAAGRDEIAARLRDAPRRSPEVTSAYAELADMTVRGAMHAALLAHPAPGGAAGRLAVVAVGGYGRGEMAPHSDVDLVFLVPSAITPWATRVIEDALYVLWDLKLKVGHASRSVKDCLALGRSDATIRTALMEQRTLCGDAALAAELERRLRREVLRGTEREFVEAKLAEREARLKKNGGQRYVTEPNVKEGKGGLRDLQTLYWIAKHVYGVADEADLVAKGLFSKDEFATFERARGFLWAVRCHMHLAAGRAVEQLTFDLQAEVAERMGYADRGGRRAVEHFMQDYFRRASDVGELTRIFLTKLEADHLKAEPMLQGLFRRRRRVRAGFVVRQNRLDLASPQVLEDDPLDMLRLFEEALRTGLLIHPDAMRAVRGHLHLIDATMRERPEARRVFLDTILRHGNPERALRRMSELGVLAAFVPEFEPITAMMQFNMYHAYTVDEHTIQCIDQLAKIEKGELEDALPLATSIMRGGVNRKVLYVALLLHDVGKGREEDHSILGARIARRVAPRLGLSKADSETVEWLVRNHLLMSDIAQKRDLSEPLTIRGFAKAVGSRGRLDLLTVLTVCDIRGVGPGTWNNWKASLLRQLHAATAAALENGMEEVSRQARGAEARASLRAALPGWSEAELRGEFRRHAPPYWQNLPTAAHAIFARLLRGIPDDEIRMDLSPATDRDATLALFAMADHPGIFSRLAGALALAGANVVDARSHTTRDGYATSAYWVQDAEGRPYDEERLPRLRRTIERTLGGEIVATEALAPKDRIKKRESAFRVPTRIHFDNEASSIYTLVEVDTRDRPGLLHDLTRALAGANVYIASAVVATYGEQAVDTFYVKDMFGLKFHARGRQEALEKRLRYAIEKGAERARD